MAVCNVIIDFTVAFPARSRCIIHSKSGELVEIPFRLWIQFAEMSDDMIATESLIQPVENALREFMICMKEFHVDNAILIRLVSEMWKFLVFFYHHIHFIH
jgi:hypothetical protein